MNRHIRWVLAVLTAASSYAALGQSGARVPAVTVSTPNRIVDVKADDVCAIDFSNIRISGENADRTAHLKNGKYKRESGSQFESAKLEHVSCLKEKDGTPHALVVTNWMDCGDSGTSVGVAQLLELRGGHPVITQLFAFDSHAEGTGAAFDEKNRTLTITGRSDDGSPKCCAQNFDLVTYQWQGVEFQQTSYERIPAPESKILLALQYDEFDMPYHASSTCLVAFRDGRLQIGRQMIFPYSGGPEFFEDSLADDDVKALRAILEAPELQQLRTMDVPPGIAITKGEMLNGRIRRLRTEQNLRLAAIENPAGIVPKSFPGSAGPLIQWVEATSKSINKLKLHPVKNVKSSSNCWVDRQ